jgi:hypothetical protein
MKPWVFFFFFFFSFFESGDGYYRSVSGLAGVPCAI